jgi:hypothetical protein
VFSDEELQRLREFPEINRAEPIRYFTLAAPDEMFVRKFRGPNNVLGAAVQLSTLPWLGFVPDEVASAPAAAVARLSDRLGIAAGLLDDYGVREQTRTDHLREIARYAGWRPADEIEWKQLQEFLFSRAMEHDSPRLLFRLACEYLASVRVIRPGVVNVLERVATARDRALAETWTRVEHLVQGGQRREELDGLLVVDPYLGRTPLAWLGTGRRRPARRRSRASWRSWPICGASTRTPWTCRRCRPSDAGSWPGWWRGSPGCQRDSRLMSRRARRNVTAARGDIVYQAREIRDLDTPSLGRPGPPRRAGAAVRGAPRERTGA